MIFPPVRMTDASARTSSSPTTWLRVTPWRTARMPPALVFTLPPIEPDSSPGYTG